jgi:hypothetical protein
VNLRDEPAFMDDGYVAAQTLDNFEYMRGEKNGHTALGHTAQERLERSCSQHPRLRTVRRERESSVRESPQQQRELFLHAV